MKELTIEEKAKAFDEALSKAKQVYKTPYTAHWDVMKELIEHLFPELKESEDERVKNKLIKFFKGYSPDEEWWGNITQEDILVWLEKQGKPMEINPTEFDTRLQALIGKFDSLPKEELIGSLSFWLNVVQNDGTYKPDEEKQNEQKSDNKPKFHEGDWVVFNNRYDSVYQVEKIENYKYILRHILGGSMPLSFSHEDMIRTWTIKDARNGDMLSNGTTIFIFKDLLSDGSVMSYCDYDTDSGESDAFCPLLMNLMCSKITPATNEQRDILFDEMGKAGYWWDAAKKELNKIKPKFKVGDLVMVSTAVGDRVVEIASVGYLKDGHPSYFTTEGRWFDNRTKARLLTDKDVEVANIPESKVIDKNKEWNEEDKLNLNQAIYVCHQNGYDGVEKWLKSLRPQKFR